MERFCEGTRPPNPLSDPGEALVAYHRHFGLYSTWRQARQLLLQAGGYLLSRCDSRIEHSVGSASVRRLRSYPFAPEGKDQVATGRPNLGASLHI